MKRTCLLSCFTWQVWNLACLLLLAAPAGLRAERLPVDCRVEVGFGGVIREQGGVFPVAVTIENKVASTTGIIELSQPDMSGSAEVAQTLPIVSPAPSSKRFVLLARIEQGRDLELAVHFKERVRDVRVKLKPTRSRQPLILCLGLPRFYRGVSVSAAYRFVDIEKKFLPDDPVALDGVHAVAVSGPVFATLTRSQIGALRRWTLTGGTFILHDPTSDGGFQGNLSDFLQGRGIDVSRRGAAVFGAGVVASSGADPEPNVAFWDADKSITERLFPGLSDAEKGESVHSSGAFAELWRTRRSWGVGGFLWVIAITGGYILTIGPLDRWLVRRLKKPYLTWVFFVVAIAVFSGIAYAYSSLVNVGEMRAIYVNCVDTACDSDVARGNSIFWVYSARNATYDIGAPLPDVVFSARESALGAGAVAGVTVANGQKSALAARIPIFSSKEFDATWYMPWTRQVVCKREGRGLRITVPKNLKLSSAFVATREGLVTLVPCDSDTSASSSPALQSFCAGPAGTQPWKDAAAGFEGALGSHSGYYGPRVPRNDKEELRLPSEALLRNYVLSMSYPRSAGDGIQGPSVAQRRDFREMTLDIRSRLKGGDMLLLFPEPADDLQPASIHGSKPRSARVDLIRMQLPPEG